MQNLTYPPSLTRRSALGTIALAAVTPNILASISRSVKNEQIFEISLAQWSLHKSLFAGDLQHMDFAKVTRETYGLGAVEYVNTFFKDHAQNEPYLKQMNQVAADSGVRQLLIMVDGEGRLGDPDASARTRAVRNHVRWLEAASTLGCHAIRVNAASAGTDQEQARLAADGLSQLADLAEPHGLDVIVENHGGLSSNGGWLAEVMQRASHPRLGTLPDFGNFCMDWSRRDDPEAWYDRYQGVAEMMPHARAVSAKSHDFDQNGDETSTDYVRMMRIVLESGYRGYVGIEYEGSKHSEHEGILATKRLLKRVREELTPEFS